MLQRLSENMSKRPRLDDASYAVNLPVTLTQAIHTSVQAETSVATAHGESY